MPTFIKMRKLAWTIGLIGFAWIGMSQADAAIRALIRFPTIHGHVIVFEAGGNLWRISTHGGVAERLTADSGYDSHPLFSPNGRWIAFSGWYEGSTDVYLMPAMGGYAKRLTYRPGLVIDWTPDSRHVVFLSGRDSTSPEYRKAFAVPITGGLAKALPLPWTGPLALSPHGRRIAYNKLFRNQSFHRKHYRGGWAQKIWIYNFRTHKIRSITHWVGTSTFPMWGRHHIYFASDRGASGTLNLWSSNLKTGQKRQLTFFRHYDIDWPSLGNTGIVFQEAGHLYWYALPEHKLVRIRVRLPLDGVRRHPYWAKAWHAIRSYALSTGGHFALFDARGNAFRIPLRHGTEEDLTPTSRANIRMATESPNRHWIAYVTDQTGHSEIAIRSNAYPHRVEILTRFSSGSLSAPSWSPNSRWLAFSDSDRRLWIVNVATRAVRLVAKDRYSWFHSYAWSPDSDWLAYSRTDDNGIPVIWLDHLINGHEHPVTRGYTSDVLPAFDPSGRYLYFVSARHANPALSATGMNFASIDADGLYAITLNPAVSSPLAVRGIPKRPSKPKPRSVTPPAMQHPQTVKALVIDWHDMMRRAVELPVPPANISELVATPAALYYASQPIATVNGPLPVSPPTIDRYSLKKRKSRPWIAGASSFVVSHDQKVALYASGPHFFYRPITPGPMEGKPVNLHHLWIRINPPEEWREMYWSAWRRVQDYFVNPDFNGYDWKRIGLRYARLLPDVATRQDLNYLIGNMIGSLDESHMFVFGGAEGYHSPAVGTGLLGAHLTLDRNNGRYRITRIFHGNNTLKNYLAPLAQPGLKARAGDYLIAIDGIPVHAPTNPYALLEHTVGKTVRLRLGTNPTGKNSWVIRVHPIANQYKLHLLAWIRHNRRLVNRLSHGQIGYIYLGNMGGLGLNEFIRQFYHQLHKKALIIDERWNTGGFIDDMLFDRLTRRLIAYFVDRQRGIFRVPANVFPGYMAALVNHGSASDGDIFAYEFEKYHLGPVIGTRTWGGVRGYFRPTVLKDGGTVVISEIALFNRKGHWTVENYGVQPNQVVHDEPGALIEGRDQQLLTAIHDLMHDLKVHPRPVVHAPAWLPAYPPHVTIYHPHR
ncbi:exported tricorn protease [mine drainage metagenome]|uniref:Exported tricorn protease n=3 Tax=mine drainage metagenome TaxID=410659 RepID=T1BTI0_9ZZZZ